MLTLAPGTRLVTAADTGRGSLVTAAGDVWTLNATAVTVVQAVEQRGGADAAATALLARFPTQDPAAVRRDVDKVLGTLLRHGAVADR
ncbi:PqqD family peptide modification chaperone [Kitasatospora cineracea]|uniref:PqqD family peptide modification chaperone n=1 Tax=Kitasatospora cineracea TaxID=88074 RepID=UPI00343FDDA3